MVITPLWEVYEGIYHARFRVGSDVYAIDTDFNLTRGKKYKITDVVGLDIEVINDVGEKEVYSDEWFSMTKPK